MRDTLTQYLASIPDAITREVLRTLFETLGDRFSSQTLNGAGLVIKAGGGVLAKTGAAVTHVSVKGKLVAIAAATDMPALTGLVIAQDTFNVACFFVDAAGTLSVLFGTQGATRAAVKFPQFPKNKALVGFLIITHSATFTGNTTPLDTATTQYVSPTGPFDPTFIL